MTLPWGWIFWKGKSPHSAPHPQLRAPLGLLACHAGSLDLPQPAAVPLAPPPHAGGCACRRLRANTLPKAAAAR